MDGSFFPGGGGSYLTWVGYEFCLIWISKLGMLKEEGEEKEENEEGGRRE